MSRIIESVKQKQLPYVTLGLIFANVVYFIILVIGGNPSNPTYMVSKGADYAPYVFENHEYWRLLTSMFMHFSFRHLSGNMIYLGIVGWTYEPVIGHLKFFLIYMLSGLGGGVVSCAYHQLTHQPAVSAGASGAVYGIIAIVIFLTFTSRTRFHAPKLFYRIAVMLVFLFYSNFVSGTGIDVAAHVGGLAFGALLCFLLIPYKSNKQRQ